MTEIDEYPWLALLKYRDKTTGDEKWGCGGTLIGRRTILTAAHCVEIETVTSSQKQLLLVRLGEHDVSKEIDCSLQDHLDCADPPRDYLIKSEYGREQLLAHERSEGVVFVTGPRKILSSQIRSSIALSNT